MFRRTRIRILAGTIIGQTLLTFRPYFLGTGVLRLKKKRNVMVCCLFCRYGPIFKTNLVGRPVVVSADPDLNYFIFQQEGKIFQSWYPDTFTEIFGKQNVGSLHGFMYKYLKNMMLNLFGPESLKKMLSEVEEAACRTLQQSSCQDSVELKDATARVNWNIITLTIFSFPFYYHILHFHV